MTTTAETTTALVPSLWPAGEPGVVAGRDGSDLSPAEAAVLWRPAMVKVSLGDASIVLSPAEARALAWILTEAAASAEGRAT